MHMQFRTLGSHCMAVQLTMSHIAQLMPCSILNMDHIMLPNDPVHPVFEVRLSDGEPCDGCDFITYPERQDWGSRTDDESLKIFKEPSTKFVGFLGRWLLFGPTMAAFSAHRIASQPISYVKLATLKSKYVQLSPCQVALDGSRNF